MSGPTGPLRPHVVLSAVAVAACILQGCGGEASAPAVRLVDLFDAANVEGAPQGDTDKPTALWDFSNPDGSFIPALGWQAGAGVADLRVVDGKLTGRAVTDFPILYALLPEAVDRNDLFHSLKVRGRSGDATELRAHLAAPKPDLAELAEGASDFNWQMAAQWSGGGAAQSVNLSQAQVAPLSGVESVMLRPADQAGETFEIESIQLLTQREHRASIPSGVGWQGLGSVFRETIVSRSPETFSIEVDIPADAWLDLHLGTVEEEPVTFRVVDSSSPDDRVLLERTVTATKRWERAAVDLSGWEGRRKLTFSLAVDGERKIGFWGGPAIRVRGADPVAAEAGAAAGVDPPRGVVLLMTDTLRADHLDAYGYRRATAPTIKRMADQGALFLDNISPAAWTKPSAPSMLTSLYPGSHGVKKIPDKLPASAVTLAEIYRDAGFATAAFCSNDFTGRMTNLQQGFEEMHEAESFETGGFDTKTALPIVDRLTRWIEQHRDTPFFVFVHLYDPHSRFEPRPPYNALWNDPAREEKHERLRKAALAAAESHNEERQFNSLVQQTDLSAIGAEAEAWLEYEKGWYDASIRGMDAEIERLLESLHSVGSAQQTVVALAADHGEEFNDHGGMGHGHQIYGEMVNVPMILYRPGVIPSVRIDATTSTVDLAPTLLASTGLAIPPDAQGQSLLPLVAGYAAGGGLEAAEQGGWEARPAISEEHKRSEDDPTDDESYAIVFGGWKLIHNVRTESKPEYELYRRAEDRLDQHNVAADHPDVVAKLAAELDSWRTMVREGMLPTSDPAQGVSSQELDKLRSLGYIQ